MDILNLESRKKSQGCFGGRFFFYALFLVSFLHPAFSQKVHYVRGKAYKSVEVNKGLITLRTGDELDFGDIIKTEDDSLVIVTFSEGSKLKVDPGTQVMLDQSFDLSDFEKGQAQEDWVNKKSQYYLKLFRGALLMKFRPEEGVESVLVEKDDVVLAVRGTEFLFGEEDNDIFASVEEGSVAVIDQKDNDYEPVKAGESVVVENGKSLTKAAKYSWAKKLNWNIDEGSTSSGFKSPAARKARRAELKKRLKTLRQRKKNVLKGKLKERLRNNKNFRKKLKKLRQNNPQKFQQLKKRMKQKVKGRFKEKAKKKIRSRRQGQKANQMKKMNKKEIKNNMRKRKKRALKRRGRRKQ